ncbi:unnamed protein product, partial [Iphiclides podalirius]
MYDESVVPVKVESFSGMAAKSPISHCIKTVLRRACVEKRLTVGLLPAIQYLSNNCNGALFCVTTEAPPGDSATHMQEVLLQAFCVENEIYNIKVDSELKLKKLLGCSHRSADFSCILVHYPYTDPFSDSQDIDLSVLSEAERDLIQYCNNIWGHSQVPVVKLPEKSNMVWRPLNLAEVCPAHTHLSACSYFGYVYLNLLVQLFGDSEDRRIQQKLRQDSEDDEQERIVGQIESFKYGKQREEEYDFIVVGAGSAGCVVANRLSQNKKWKVLLLEAGPEAPDVTLVPGLSTALLGSNIDWGYSTEPDGKSCLAFGGRCSWARGKVMGGSSSINSLAYIRGNRADYDGWAAMGNDGWSYKDVLPYFKKSERNMNAEGLDRKYHGVRGEQYVSRYPYVDKPSIMMTDAFNERGLPLNDYNAQRQEGAMQSQAFSLDGERVSANVAFIRPIRYRRRNLTIKTNAEAFKVLVNGHKRAYGVKYTRDKLTYTALAKKEVIVSGGTINSPKLLMLSGIGPKEQLERLGIEVVQDLAVGENLHDHVTFNGMVISLANDTATLLNNEEVVKEVKRYHHEDIKDGPLSANGAVSSISFFKTRPDLPAPDIQYQVDSVNWEEYIKEPADYDSTRIFPTGFYDGLMPRTMNLVPKSRGRLCLNATDPNGPPLLYANYFGNEEDFVPLIKGIRYLLSLEDTNAFRNMGARFVRINLPGCERQEWGTDDYIVCLARHYTSTTYHPVGTCKMGPKWDRTAVVDPRLRVYGISGLRVIDASIMPVVVRGNTNAPAIMIGERGASWVIDDWLHGDRRG